MINVSNKFKQALLDDKRQFQIEATITLIDDTELTITNSELWSQGFEIDTSVSGNNSFDIGGFIIGRMTLVINNIYEDYTQYDFFDADVDVTLTLPFDDGTSESIVFDSFIVDEATDNESQIVLTCLDNAKLFERPYSESNLVYPASIDTIVRDACDTCGVPLLTTSIRNGNYVVPTRPSSDGLTFLKVVSWCAQLTGNFARIDNHGQLVVGWYDRNTYDSVNKVNGTEWTITGNTAKKFHHIVSWSSLTVGTDDVTITGLRVVATSSDNTEFVGFYGSEGYVLEVRGNDLIGVSDVQNIANSIGANVVGLKLRTYNGACLGDPTIEASDLIWITDRKNRSYKTLICGTSFKLGQYQSLYCGASTPSKRASTSYSESTRAIVKTRQEIKKSLADYDSRVSSMAELIARGFGMYFTPVTQQDGSVIPYIHDEPTIEESSYIAYMTSQGIMMESDGESTAAVDRNGNALLNTLTTRGINADWINSGAISIKDTQGNETFYANCLTGVVRINATSFSLTGSTVQQIAQEAVDNIRVGGRNLLLNSSFSTDYNQWSKYATYGIVSEDGYACGHITGYSGGATLKQDILDRIKDDEAGQIYTISADIKLTNYADGTNGSSTPFLALHLSGHYDKNGVSTWINGRRIGGTVDTGNNHFVSISDKGWFRLNYIFDFTKKPSEMTDMGAGIYARNWSGDLYFKNMKLERGNKATDWTPAPEDLQTGISNAVSTANTANATANNANATAQQALSVASSAGGLVAYLDNDYQSVPTDADGNYVTFPECSSKITVFYNSNDVSTQCTYATAVTSGVTGTWDNATRTYSMTGLSTDSGTVTITVAYNNTSLSKKFTVIKVRQGISGTNGTDGQDGTDGQNGRGVSLMEEYYAVSASNSTAPGSWSTTVQAPTEEYPYLWNYNRVVYTDNTWEDTLPRVIGNFAKDGEDGEDGQNGRGITSIVEHYGLSNSTTTEPASWSNTMQVPTSSAKYLWNYETITYTDGTTGNTTKRIIGNYSANGAGAYNYELILSDVAIVKDAEGNITPSTITMTAKRNQGTGSPSNYAGRFKIETTTNGTTYTTAYTSSANEATHTYTPTGNEKNIRILLYLAGGTSTLLDSQNVPVISDGVDGVSPTITSSKSGSVTTVTITDASGSRTLTINDGTAGASIATVTNYYLASASATGVTTSTSGWTTNPTASGATISASKPYLWNYEVSKDNNNVTIATTSPAIIGHFGKNGTNGTNGTNGADGQDGQDGRGISSITEYYAISESTTAPDDSNFTSEYVLTPDPIHKYLWNYEVIAYTDNTSTRTSKHIIGVYGDPGEAGKDAYTVILSNESHTFAGTGGHAIASSVDCNIIAYKGATRVAATIGNITGTITNKLSVTKTDSGLTTARITVSATNTLDTQSGVLTIPITVDGKSFTKTFSWSVAYNGSDGVTARSYILDVTPKSVKIGENLAYTPNSIMASSYYRDGDSATLTAFTGYMFVEVCNENNAWSAISGCYNSTSTFTFTLTYTTNSTASYNRSTGVLSLPATMSALRIKLKPTSNSSVILDQQDIILLVDISSLTQATVFNKLTNNGVNKGIYLEGNDLYVNASYIKSGTLILGGSKNVRGTLKVLAENGSTEYVKLNYDGITAIKGEIGGWTIDDHSIRRDKSDSTGSNKINTLIQCPSGSTSTVLAIGAEYKNGATDWTTAPFRVTALGKMYATGAEISGKITATSGKIGGWDITTNSLRNETEGTSNNILIGSTTNNVLSIGATWTSGAEATDWSTGKFRVLKNGSMYATAGEIGSWKITSNSIRREEKDGADALFLCPTGSTSTVLSIGAPTVSNSIKWAQAPFYVKGSGKLYATGASINGTFESKDGTESVKIVNGIIYGYSGSSECGSIDMSSLYGSSSRNVSVYGYKELHLQCGSRISFEANGVEEAWFDSRGLHDSYGFSGSFYVATGYGSDGLPTGWFRLNVKNGIIKD